MSCANLYDFPGIKTHSSLVPDSCQGAYFPGDEPGEYCRATHEPCGDVEGKNPCECGSPDYTDWACPRCSFRERNGALVAISGHGVLFCPDCGATWKTERDLAEEINEELYDAKSRIEELELQVKRLQQDTANLIAPMRRFFNALPASVQDELAS